jgi:hypothetical protein
MGRHNFRDVDFGDQITTEGCSEYLATLLKRHMKTINLDWNLLWRIAVEICKQRYFGEASSSETSMTIYQQTNTPKKVHLPHHRPENLKSADTIYNSIYAVANFGKKKSKGYPCNSWYFVTRTSAVCPSDTGDTPPVQTGRILKLCAFLVEECSSSPPPPLSLSLVQYSTLLQTYENLLLAILSTFQTGKQSSFPFQEVSLQWQKLEMRQRTINTNIHCINCGCKIFNSSPYRACKTYGDRRK